MTQDKIIKDCENLLVDKSTDPLYQMCYMLMEMEANKITGSEKGEHNSNRTDYRSETRERRFDTRLGTFNLQIPKFRNSDYVTFSCRTGSGAKKLLSARLLKPTLREFQQEK